MALAPNTRPAPFGAITIFGAVTRMERAWSAFVTWNTVRKTRNQLVKLSNRDLADIGLHRGALEDLHRHF
ncbi:MAG: DUF1127 domain-containing protein [Pseudomonadota bacterium]